MFFEIRMKYFLKSFFICLNFYLLKFIQLFLYSYVNIRQARFEDNQVHICVHQRLWCHNRNSNLSNGTFIISPIYLHKEFLYYNKTLLFFILTHVLIWMKILFLFKQDKSSLRPIIINYLIFPKTFCSFFLLNLNDYGKI